MLMTELPAFAGLSDFQKNTFVGACQARAVSAGEDLLSEEAAADSIFFVMEGRLRVHVGGRELATLEAPCVIGELELFTDELRPVTVTALTAAETLYMPYAAFRQRLAGDDIAALKIAYNLAKVLAGRLAETDRVVAGHSDA